MYIKELILEGFKSYAGRTVISGFDIQFNAITGLNGSGKSNILDAILFALGMSKELEVLRIKKVQELIYKGGNAGIQKAEVTIVFDNSDKVNSPLGYEKCDEIIITRQITLDKGKYFVNGHNETQQKIKGLLRSVQLNVDNPHFLVAQGRITKITNLRGTELMSMLEETAGTSLYNEKKKESQRIIQKKEEKVKEVNELILKSIMPQIAKLKKEREHYMVYKNNEQTLATLNRQLRSAEFLIKSKVIEQRKREHQQLKENEEDKANEIKELNEDLQRLKEILQKNKGKITNNNSQQEYQKLVDQCNELRQQLANLSMVLEVKQKTMQTSEQDSVKFEENVKQLSNDNARLKNRSEVLHQTQTNLSSQIDEKTRLLREIELVLSNQSSEEAAQQLSLQINENEKQQKNNNIMIQNLHQKLSAIQSQLEQGKQQTSQIEQEQKSNHIMIERLEKEIKDLESSLETTNFNENSLLNLNNQKRNIDENIMQLRIRLNESFQQQMHQFKLSFKDPYHQFDRNRIKGKVFQLFEPFDMNHSKALEAGAAGKLYQIVIDNEQTGKALLEKDCFNYHVSFIPLTQVAYKEFPQEFKQLADQMARELGGWAKPAIDLINYNPELKKAMLYTFGNFFVASNQQIAKAIVFDNANKQLKMKVVTVDGDIFDPSGTLSGGFLQSQSLLKRYQEYCNAIKEVEQENKQLQVLEGQIEKAKQDVQYHQNIREEILRKRQKIDTIKDKQKRTQQYKESHNVEGLNHQAESIQEQIKIVSQQLVNLANEREDLSKEESMHSKGNILSIQKEKKNKIQKTISELKKSYAEKKQELVQIETNIEQNQQQIVKYQKMVEQEQKEMVTLKQEIQKLQAESTLMQENLREKDSIRVIREKDQQQKDHEYLKVQSSYQTISKDLDEAEKEKKKIENHLQKVNRDIKDLDEALTVLEQKFEFILPLKKEFLKVESDLEEELQNIDFDQTQAKVQALEQQQNQLSKKVNVKVEAMFDKVEKEYNQLLQKKETLENDKLILNNNITELDQKRLQTIQKCFMIVNQNFQSIFSSLLPGAQAKLSPIESDDLSQGMEISVGFNNKWKSNLGELSGGQRSLLALSFILSLLKYKPAPFYILDEVDSALDLSHTENIGAMIAKNFKQSQFILISLKEGMYSNANVLFKVSFVEGLSKIERLVLKEKERKRREQMQIQ